MSRVDADVAGLIAKLTQRGDRAVKGVSDVMQKYAERIKKRAIRYAPVDEGNLEKSIFKSSRRGGKGRTEVTIGIDADRPAPSYNADGSVTKGTEDKTVGDYAVYMHEGSYNLGPKSEVKNSVMGGGVGPKFLERAAEDEREAMMAEARAVVKKEMGT